MSASWLSHRSISIGIANRFNDWQVVVIYPSKKTEQDELFPHRSFLNGDQLHRIYLDELGDIQQLPLWCGADGTDNVR